MAKQRNSAGHELDFLGKLSIEELEALLKTSGDHNDVEAFFDAVIEEVIKREKKEPTGRLPDVDTAWEEFQTYYNTPEKLAQEDQKGEQSIDFILKKLDTARNECSSPAKPRKAAYRVLHSAAVIAISILLTLAVMIGVQAAGMNVFGALAHFTENTFRFVTDPSPREETIQSHNKFQDSIDVEAILGAYTPTWRPEGSAATGSKRQEDELGIFTEVSFSLPNDRYFCIRIDQYKSGEDINAKLFERDAVLLDEYAGNLGKYYIYSNEEYLIAISSDGTSVQNIWGSLTVDELKLMIDSIGGS